MMILVISFGLSAQNQIEFTVQNVTNVTTRKLNLGVYIQFTKYSTFRTLKYLLSISVEDNKVIKEIQYITEVTLCKSKTINTEVSFFINITFWKFSDKIKHEFSWFEIYS